MDLSRFATDDLRERMLRESRSAGSGIRGTSEVSGSGADGALPDVEREPLPERGAFDVRRVIESGYFFS